MRPAVGSTTMFDAQSCSRHSIWIMLERTRELWWHTKIAYHDLRLLEQLATHGLRATPKNWRRWRSCVTVCVSLARHSCTKLSEMVESTFPKILTPGMSSKHSTDWKYHLQPWLKFGMKKKHITHKAEVAASPFGASIALSNGRVTLNCDFSFRLLLQLRILLGRAPGLRVFRWTPSKNSLATRSTCNVQRANVPTHLLGPCSILMSWRMLRFDFVSFMRGIPKILANWCYGHGITWKQMEWRHELTWEFEKIARLVTTSATPTFCTISRFQSPSQSRQSYPRSVGQGQREILEQELLFDESMVSMNLIYIILLHLNCITLHQGSEIIYYISTAMHLWLQRF